MKLRWAEREAFEKWLDSEHLFDTAEFIYNEAIKQKAKDENLVWKAWQAATKAERERCAKQAQTAPYWLNPNFKMPNAS